MNRDKFNALISKDKSGWLKSAKRRKKWRWLSRLTMRPRIKYLRLKRKFLLFLSLVSVPKGTVCPACKIRKVEKGWYYCEKCMGDLDII